MNRKPVKRKSKVIENNANMPKTPKVESKCYTESFLHFSIEICKTKQILNIARN